MEVNNLLKRSLNYNEVQIFKKFMQQQENFEKVNIFKEGVEKIIGSNNLRHMFDMK